MSHPRAALALLLQKACELADELADLELSEFSTGPVTALEITSERDERIAELRRLGAEIEAALLPD